MTLALQETGIDHQGRPLPSGVCAQSRRDTGALVSFRVRWRQVDDRGRRHRPSKSFSVHKLGSADRALDAATFFLAGAEEASRVYQRKGKRSRALTANDVFAEWMKIHAVGLERIIEAVLGRPGRDRLFRLRDAALVAAMGFTVATRPSEWRLAATWGDLRETTIEIQRPRRSETRSPAGLKTGAHVALLLPNARDRLLSYRQALEALYGPQPADALVFQLLGPDGPEWTRPKRRGECVPLAWTKNAYNRWVLRIWAPARITAARSPDAPPGLAAMKFYDCRHTAISMALHSTLVVGPLGMNLHPLAAMAGHNIQTLENYYRHIIVRYIGKPPVDLWQECARARASVEEAPFSASPRKANAR